MQGIIIYKGKYGATKQYAEWLGEQTNLPVATSDEITEAEFKNYDFFVLGTSVYFGKFMLKKWLKNNLMLLTQKKAFLFIVTATPKEAAEERNKLIQRNLPTPTRSYCNYYFLPGRIIHSKLSLRDRLILKFVGSFEKDPVKKRALSEDINAVSKEELLPLATAVKKYLSADGQLT